MTIGQVFNHYRTPYGGEERVFEGTKRILRDHGHIVFSLERSSLEIQGRSKEIRALFTSVYNPLSRREMYRLIKANQPEVVHVHNVYPLLSPSVLLACRDARTPIVFTVHNLGLSCPIGLHVRNGRPCFECNGPGHEVACVRHNCAGSQLKSLNYALRAAFARRHRWFLDTVTLFLAPSTFILEYLVGLGVSDSRIALVPPPVQNAQTEPTSPSRAPSKSYVAFAGRLIPEKGIDTLLAAATYLPTIPFRIAGDGDLRARYETEAPGNVEFVGPLADAGISNFYRQARFAVVPSLCFEAFGLAAAEPMVVGCPVVVSARGGLTDIVEVGKGGIQFPAGDPQALAQEIRTLWDDPQLCRLYGDAARASILRRYSESVYYDKLLNAYERAKASIE